VVQTSIKNIAVIHPGTLGDLVIAAYAVKSLRRAFPEAQLDAFTRFDVWSLFPDLVDSWVDIETSGLHRIFVEVAPEIIGARDIVVSWMGSKDKNFVENLARSTGAKIVAGSTKPDEKTHAVDHAASVLKELGINAGADTLDFAPKPEWESELKRILDDLDLTDLAKLLVVHPGSGASWKCWPAENFALILSWWRSSGKPALLLEGPADGDIVKAIQNRITAIPTLSNPPLPVLATLLGNCAVYVGNDSGVTQMAAAVGANVAAIFGPTDPEIWAPRGKNVNLIKGETDCAPCLIEKRRECKDLKCLDEITVENMKAALKLAKIN